MYVLYKTQYERGRVHNVRLTYNVLLSKNTTSRETTWSPPSCIYMKTLVIKVDVDVILDTTDIVVYCAAKNEMPSEEN